MSTSETRYTFRARVPVTLERGRAQRTTLEAYRDGALVAPAVMGSSYSLIDPQGQAIVDSQPVGVVNSVAYYDLDTADLATSRPLGIGYQERWSLVMPDGTTRTVRRTAALARFELHPVATDADILAEYPGLLNDIGDYGSNFQGWLDAAWGSVVRTLWAHNDFPHILVEPSDVFEWLSHEVLYRVFRSLSRSGGDTERWRALWEDHSMRATEARTGLTIRVDRDGDGLQDHAGRESAGVVSIDWHTPYTSDPRHISSRYR